MDSVLLGLRVIVSLAIVLGLMWGLSRVARGRQSVRGLPIEVVARTPMGRHSSVVIVNVQGRGLVLGVTEQSMTMLAEVELEAEQAPAERRETLDLTRELDGTYGLLALPAAPVATSPQTATVTQLPLPATTDATGRREARAATSSGGSALEGSILSPSTWRSMATALRERSVRG